MKAFIYTIILFKDLGLGRGFRAKASKVNSCVMFGSVL